MQGFAFARHTAGLVVASLLTGCTGAGVALPTNGGSPATLVTSPGARPNRDRPATAVPLIQPHCCAREKTLFVTDAFGGSSGNGAVYMFNYKTTKEIGQVPAPPEGWLEVQGACVDKAGNVYFANTSMSTVDEYTHSGTYLATLTDSGQYPVDCAYDSTTGNLAVSNIISTSGGSGSVSVFKGGVLQNTFYPSNIYRVYFVGYQDGTGTLWLDGENSSGVFQYDKFSNGTFTPVAVTGGTIGFPGGVQWSAKTRAMNLGDQSTSSPTIYQVSSSGRIVGSTVLACQPSEGCDVAQFVIKGPAVVASDANGACLYPYPAGGEPTKCYAQNLNSPAGVAISPNVR